MPKIQQKAPRQKPVSCSFCRQRKLKCSRESPCTNCVSRDVACDWETPIARSIRSPSHGTNESEILNRLRRLEELLANHSSLQHGQPQQTPVMISMDTASPVAIHSSELSPHIQKLADDVASLRSVYTGSGLGHCAIPSNGLVFKVCGIREGQKSEFYFRQSANVQSVLNGELTRCIWLPKYEEFLILLEKYLRDVNYFHHIIHVPSLRCTAEKMYIDLNQQTQINPSCGMLLISIIASATQSWVLQDCETGLFPTVEEARAQAPIWVKAAEEVLDIVYRTTNPTIECIQALITVSFVTASLEGFSRRCKSLFYLGLYLGKELGLHCIDHPSNTKTNTISAEVGRRLWWYLCCTDWAMGARFDGKAEGTYSCHPRQMLTRKPLNLNDEDIFDGMSGQGRPMEEPTSMTFQLFRIRLGETYRDMVDRTPLMLATVGCPSRDAIMDMDTNLQLLFNELPRCLTMTKEELIDTYDLSSDFADKYVHQGTIAQFFIHGQRLKLHLPYFTRGFSDKSFASSREICVTCASMIIQIESSLSRAGIAYSSCLKFTGLLLGVFMATVVLIMEVCVNRSSLHLDERQTEIAEAFRLLQEARSESEAAEKFLGDLTKILRKHKMNPCINGGDGESKYQTPTQPKQPNIGESNFGNYNDFNMSVDNFPGENLSVYLQEFTQSFEQGGMSVENFNWNDVLDFGSSLV